MDTTPRTAIPAQRTTGDTDGPSEALRSQLRLTYDVLAACRGLGRSRLDREAAGEAEETAVSRLLESARREDRARRGSRHEAERWALRQVRLHRERLDCLERLGRAAG